ncbi:hypothetical protein GCM10009123_16560 [Kangiella japonica]|uniref:Tyr recombinase domain-containing protein n=1 Tax=Kangiella japonica TaxID=647384 RepID=A0ABN0T252_9GAMM
MSNKAETKHLKLRGNIWWYQRRVPKHLSHHYPNQSFIQISLDTGDIREARKKRNVLNGELERKSLSMTSNSESLRFRELVREMDRDRKNYPHDWDAGIYPDRLEEQGRKLELEAYMTVNGRQDFSRKYRLTISEGFQMWLDDIGHTKTEEHSKKIEKAIKKFGTYCFKHFDWVDSPDIAIEDIERKMVYSFIKHLGKTLKKSTVQATISRINTIWMYLERVDELEGKNPFKDHIYSNAEADQSEKREAFTKDEVKKIQAHKWEKPVYKLLVDLGIYSGCRISELCNLKKKDVVEDDGIVAMNIEKGKTRAATRTVPLPDFIGQRLLEHIKDKDEDDLVLGISSKTASRTFSNFKTRYISQSKLKAFHSFRHMYITAMERAGVEENVTAQIVGHERGKTMSYGYYSKGHELKKLKEAVEKGLRLMGTAEY